MTDLKAEKYKKMLQEIGGWDNSLVSVNSGAVRSIIEDLERIEADKVRLEHALERSVLAIDDWLNTYASDMCDPDRVAQARSRINNYGTIGYIADVQKQNRDAIRGDE